MPKTIILLRHAQGTHNLPSADSSTHDPSLTAQGLSDCSHLANTFPHHASITLLCASPMRRGLQTARTVFRPVLDRGLRILALPDAQEGWGNAANTGSPLGSLKEEFGEREVDWSEMGEGWEIKSGDNAVDPGSLRRRRERLMRWLSRRGEDVVVVVGHGYFGQWCVGNIDGEGGQIGPDWGNLEWRVFRLVGGKGGEEWRLEGKEMVVDEREVGSLPN